MKDLPVRPGMDVYDSDSRYVGVVTDIVRGWEVRGFPGPGDPPDTKGGSRSLHERPIAYISVSRRRSNPLRRLHISASRITAISMERIVVEVASEDRRSL